MMTRSASKEAFNLGANLAISGRQILRSAELMHNVANKRGDDEEKHDVDQSSRCTTEGALMWSHGVHSQPQEEDPHPRQAT